MKSNTFEELIFSRPVVNDGWFEDFRRVFNSQEDSIEVCEQVVSKGYQLDPSSKDGFSRLGLGLHKLGFPEQAKRLFEKDLHVNRMQRWQFLRYLECLIELGVKLDEIPEIIENYYRKNPKAVDAWVTVAQSLQENSDINTYRSLFRRDLQLNRISGSMKLQLARYEAKNGNYVEAERLLKELFSLSKDVESPQSNSESKIISNPIALSEEGMLQVFDCWTQGFHDPIHLILKGLKQWLPNETIFNISESILSGNTTQPVDQFLEHHLCKNSRVRLKNAEIQYVDFHSLRMLLKEILIDESYCFSTQNSSGIIIDAGANIGLAVYYFKQKYPNHGIIAVEPDPDIANVLRKNAERNNWSDVQIVEAAITGSEKDYIFYSTPQQSMAGSTTTRMIKRGVQYIKMEVKGIPISQLTSKNIDLLKLDIEGAEDEAIRAFSENLHLVENLFCEIHYLPDSGYQNLSYIIEILEENNFEIAIQNPASLFGNKKKGFKNIGDRSSLELWAKQRRYVEKDTRKSE